MGYWLLQYRAQLAWNFAIVRVDRGVLLPVERRRTVVPASSLPEYRWRGSRSANFFAKAGRTPVTLSCPTFSVPTRPRRTLPAPGTKLRTERRLRSRKPSRYVEASLVAGRRHKISTRDANGGTPSRQPPGARRPYGFLGRHGFHRPWRAKRAGRSSSGRQRIVIAFHRPNALTRETGRQRLATIRQKRIDIASCHSSTGSWSARG